ncbi:hypothetical protein FGO68_gene17367 [Halteria grandinella]|uniref:Uncharacterized protein n=1 Tax=Halteria grandinella TaxID=5974 RepID=A0A8J8NEB6_HALGN|nr:hypothetical protein FGO68_gene17367 [Halteria grandinella]
MELNLSIESKQLPCLVQMNQYAINRRCFNFLIILSQSYNSYYYGQPLTTPDTQSITHSPLSWIKQSPRSCI